MEEKILQRTAAISDEQYEESLKDAQRIYDRAMMEQKKRDPMGALIEKQVEEVADYLAASVRTRMNGDLNSAVLFMEEACGRLLQIVQNQQGQIEALLRARRDECSHPYVQNDVCVECGAPWSEVKQ